MWCVDCARGRPRGRRRKMYTTIMTNITTIAIYAKIKVMMFTVAAHAAVGMHMDQQRLRYKA